MSHQTLSSTSIYQGHVFEVRNDHIRLPSGVERDYDIVEHPGAVTIVPWDQDARIWFVRQFRPATNGTLLELPAGTLEVGEEPLTCALRESQEEIGMLPGNMQHLTAIFLAPGYATEINHIFLATDLQPDPLPPDGDEDFEIEKLSLTQALAYIHSGKLQDAKSIAGIFLAAESMGSLDIPA